MAAVGLVGFADTATALGDRVCWVMQQLCGLPSGACPVVKGCGTCLDVKGKKIVKPVTAQCVRRCSGHCFLVGYQVDRVAPLWVDQQCYAIVLSLPLKASLYQVTPCLDMSHAHVLWHLFVGSIPDRNNTETQVTAVCTRVMHNGLQVSV